MFDWVYVYALREVDTLEYRYIGQTDNISRRLVEHRQKKYRDYEKETWIENILANESDIEIIELEKCERRFVNSRERYWIKHYSDLGHRLFNKRLR